TIVNFISHSVVVGFTTGAAILIASKQLKNFFGVPIPRDGGLYSTLLHFGHQVPNINFYITVIALATLVTGFVFKRFMPKFPPLIAALVVGTGGGLLLDALYGNSVTNIVTVGALPQTLPPLSLPDFNFKTMSELFPAALAMTLFALTEAVSIGRAVGIRSGQLIDGNQEFIGQGMSNMAGRLCCYRLIQSYQPQLSVRCKDADERNVCRYHGNLHCAGYRTLGGLSSQCGHGRDSFLCSLGPD
ncbi:MAG: hypothetical protein GXP11_07900, partial [Gammaproteobacteria bacterium]|nr:hypothetical protein [Gammaproteobacteria bacterium]